MAVSITESPVLTSAVLDLVYLALYLLLTLLLVQKHYAPEMKKIGTLGRMSYSGEII